MSHPVWLLALVMTSAGILSALFLNDTIAIVMTPLIMELARARGNNPIPFLVGLALAVNIGSVTAITGNPQNMIIGVASGIGYFEFIKAQAPIASGGMIIAWLVVWLVFRRELGGRHHSTKTISKPKTYPPLLWKSGIAAGLLLIALLLGAPVPVAALLAASILLVTRRTKPERVFKELDWNLLVFFIGLFIVTGAIEQTKWAEWLSVWIQSAAGMGITVFSLASALLSNLISNVPAVLLFRPHITTLENPEQAWLVLAMATTLAGNLTYWDLWLTL
ncbi:MAG: hypothetical protein LR015_02835 [Verrucomicrobia bacterium]|nr:hypothetical protein [Verrucomicrobiota bacterium]